MFYSLAFYNLPCIYLHTHGSWKSWEPPILPQYFSCFPSVETLQRLTLKGHCIVGQDSVSPPKWWLCLLENNPHDPGWPCDSSSDLGLGQFCLFSLFECMNCELSLFPLGSKVLTSQHDGVLVHYVKTKQLARFTNHLLEMEFASQIFVNVITF